MGKREERIKEKVREKLKGFAVIDETMLEAIFNMINDYEKKIEELEKEVERLKDDRAFEAKLCDKTVEDLSKKIKEQELKITSMELALKDLASENKKLKQQLKSFKKSVIKIVDERIKELKKEIPTQPITTRLTIKELQQLKRELNKNE